MELEAGWSAALAGLVADGAQALVAGLLAGLGNWGLGLALAGAVLLVVAYGMEWRGRRREGFGG